MIDLHIHILPGLDDGPEEMDESLEMCRAAVKDGADTLVATPHMCDGVYNVPREKVLEGVLELNRRLLAAQVPLTVVPGADVHLDTDLPRLLAQGRLVTVNDRGKYLMVELPHDVLPQGLAQVLFDLQVAGVTPIISHPERNVEVQADPAVLARFVKTGNLVQLTAASITGDFGERPERCAHNLLRRRLAHVVASDAHSAAHRPPGLSRARDVVAGLLASARASPEEVEAVFLRRPAQILAGESVDVPDPDEFQEARKKRWFSWRR